MVLGCFWLMDLVVWVDFVVIEKICNFVFCRGCRVGVVNGVGIDGWCEVSVDGFCFSFFWVGCVY